MQKTTSYVIAAAALTGALLIGGSYGPKPDHPKTRAWYKSLRKPSFTPPKPVYGVAWSALGALLVFSGSRLLTAPQSRTRTSALGLWVANVLGIALWPKLFFGRKNLPASVAAAGGMTLSAAGLAAASAKTDRLAGYATLPLIAWLGFATVLDEEIWRKNDEK
jgi:benzodiazapine receptor